MPYAVVKFVDRRASNRDIQLLFDCKLLILPVGNKSLGLDCREGIINEVQVQLFVKASTKEIAADIRIKLCCKKLEEIKQQLVAAPTP